MSVVVTKKPESVEEFIKIVEERLGADMLPAVDPVTLICKYRTSDGRACIIGLCITDEEYQNSYIGNAVVETWSVYSLNKYLPKWLSVHKACRLQDLHDGESFEAKFDKDCFLKQVKEILYND